MLIYNHVIVRSVASWLTAVLNHLIFPILFGPPNMIVTQWCPELNNIKDSHRISHSCLR